MIKPGRPLWFLLALIFATAAAFVGTLWQLQIVFAAPETWYALSSAGAACGVGDREALSETAGSSVATKLLDGTGDTWNRTESARTISSGNWQVLFDATTGSGGGPPNKVTVLVERRNSGCTVQQTNINEEITLSKGTTQEYTTTFTDPGAVAFSASDILKIELSQTNGGQTVTLRYDNTAASDADTRLTHPGASTAYSETPTDIATLGDAFGLVLGLNRTGTSPASLGDIFTLGLGVPRTSPAGLGDAIDLGVGLSRTSPASMSDAFVQILGVNQAATSPAGMSDVFALILGLNQAATSPASLSDAFALSLGLNRIGTSPASLGDAFALAFGSTRTSAATLGDAFALGLGLEPDRDLSR